MKKLTGLLAFAFVLVSMFGASPAWSEIRIGSVLSLTGPADFLGEPQKKALEVYVERINEASGVNGEQIRLIIYDDESKASLAHTYAKRLVNLDNVVAVIAGSTSGASLAMIPVFQSAEIPFMSLSGSSRIVNPVRKWVFKLPQTEIMACAKTYTDLKKRSLSRIAIIAGQDAFSQSMLSACKDMAEEYGIDILAVETYGPGDSSMVPQLTAIKRVEGLQAVVNTGIGQAPAIITRNLRQLNMEVPLYLSHGAATQGYLNLAGSAAEGVRLPGPAILVAKQLPDSQLKQVLLDFKSVYKKTTGKAAGPFGGYARDSLMLLVDAMRRAGSSDAAKVREAIEKTDDFVGTVGTVKMSPNNHLGIGLGAFKMLTVHDGEWALADSGEKTAPEQDQ